MESFVIMVQCDPNNILDLLFDKPVDWDDVSRQAEENVLKQIPQDFIRGSNDKINIHSLMLGGVIEFRRRKGFSEEEMASYLEISTEQLNRLGYHRKPQLQTWIEDINRIRVDTECPEFFIMEILKLT